MCLWQMLSYGIYGIVAGTKKYFELNSVKKEQGKLNVELTEQIRELENMEEKLKSQL